MADDTQDKEGARVGPRAAAGGCMQVGLVQPGVHAAPTRGLTREKAEKRTVSPLEARGRPGNDVRMSPVLARVHQRHQGASRSGGSRAADSHHGAVHVHAFAAL